MCFDNVTFFDDLHVSHMLKYLGQCARLIADSLAHKYN